MRFAILCVVIVFNRRFFTAAATAALALGVPAGVAAQREVSAPWAERLLQELPRIDADSRARLGVYVRDLDTGVSVSWHADQRWYIASMVKVPVAIAVLRGVERGQYTLDTTVTLRASDYVDGAGLTNNHPVGTALGIRFLLEQMLIYSDNTASDMLIDLVGVAEVNAVVEELAPEGGFRRITSLGDVRRMIYGQLVPNTDKLRGQDLLVLNRQRVDAERMQMLSALTETPVARFRLSTLDAAYNAYYASGVNSARLDAYGELLAQLVEGRALQPATTGYLLKLMERVATGARRVKAGLPPGVRFAHKTGTQRRRVCDAGLLRFTEAGRARRAIVVACARDEPALALSESALAQVGAALCQSGLLTEGIADAPHCHVLPPARGIVSPAAGR